MNSLIFVYLRKSFFPFIFKNIFAGYRILGWCFFIFFQHLKYTTRLSSSFHCFWWEIWCNPYPVSSTGKMGPACSSFFGGSLCLWSPTLGYGRPWLDVFGGHPAWWSLTSPDLLFGVWHWFWKSHNHYYFKYISSILFSFSFWYYNHMYVTPFVNAPRSHNSWIYFSLCISL